MLVNSDDGGPLEVYLVMLRAPISWGPVINIDSIRSVGDLYGKVTEHEKALIYASRMETSHPVTSENLLYNLHRVGILPSPSNPSRRQDPPTHRANLGETLQSTEGSHSDDNCNTQDCETSGHNVSSNDDTILKEAYQVLKQCQRAPPKGGYPFPRNDNVMTKLGRAPPLPCKVCGSKNHWDKECPDFNTFLETRKRSGNSVFSMDSETEEEQRYSSAYSILLDSCIAAQIKNWDESPLPQGFHEAAREAFSAIEERFKPRRKSDSRDETKKAKRATIEEVEDEDEVRMRNKPKCTTGALLEDATEDQGLQPEERESYRTESAPAPSSMYEDDDQPTQDKSPPTVEFPSPLPQTRVRIPKARNTAPGESSVGILVLAVRGKLGSVRNPEIDLRLDSCADITFISEAIYEELLDKPKLQQGKCMNLWQLTDKDCTIKGYVRIPVLIESREGILLEFEAKAYIVPRMTVPILLGEDFQTTYELAVQRSVMEGTTVSIRSTDFEISAIAANRTEDFT